MPTVPTVLFVIGGRIQADGSEDLPAARALQGQFTLTPLAVDQGWQAPARSLGFPRPIRGFGRPAAEQDHL